MNKYFTTSGKLILVIQAMLNSEFFFIISLSFLIICSSISYCLRHSVEARQRKMQFSSKLSASPSLFQCYSTTVLDISPNWSEKKKHFLLWGYRLVCQNLFSLQISTSEQLNRPRFHTERVLIHLETTDHCIRLVDYSEMLWPKCLLMHCSLSHHTPEHIITQQFHCTRTHASN